MLCVENIIDVNCLIGMNHQRVYRERKEFINDLREKKKREGRSSSMIILTLVDGYEEIFVTQVHIVDVNIL